jgi:D-sedoheptulose 7-phosphate isomerase
MNWDKVAEEYLSVAQQVLSEMRAAIETVAADLAARIERGNKVMICGNGGSAADAQHFAAELVNRFLLDRRPYAAIALTTDTSVMTSIGNDYGYEHVFAKQVEGLGRAGDALVAISTSGNAPNVCRAVEAARKMDLHTVALTGGEGGQLMTLADTVLCVSCTTSTPRIQEGHGVIIHALCEQMEEILR